MIDYPGTTPQEKCDLEVIYSNIDYFNQGKRKGKLSATKVISDGNKMDIYKDDKLILGLLTIHEAYYAIAAICNYVKGE